MLLRFFFQIVRFLKECPRHLDFVLCEILNSKSIDLIFANCDLDVLNRLQKDPPAGIAAVPSDDNILIWHAFILG